MACLFSFLGLLSLLAVSQAADIDCENLIKPLVLKEDYSSVMGKWIFIEGIANHPWFTNILKAVNSSWIAFNPTPYENTFSLSQGNMINGKCEFTTVNMTWESSMFSVNENNITTKGNFLPSCSDCLTMNFTSLMKNETISSLYMFNREGKVSASQMDKYWKQAQCLGLSNETQFSYDGVTDFCQRKKNDSSECQIYPEKIMNE